MGRRAILDWGIAVVIAVCVAVIVTSTIVEIGVCTLPGRGDVVCLMRRLSSPARREMALIKTRDGRLVQRISATPGDTVRIEAGRLELKNIGDKRCYPWSEASLWNGYHWGAMRMPKRGDIIALTAKNVALYGSLVERYEGRKIHTDPRGYYAFKHSYYFCLSDDLECLNDSRLYGPIPEANVLCPVTIIR